MKSNRHDPFLKILTENNNLSKLITGPEDVENNVIQFPTPALAGKPPMGGNWLSDLKTGSVFLVKHKPSANTMYDYTLGCFHLVTKLDNSVQLMNNTNQEVYVWVDPSIFCRLYDLWKLLEEGDDE